MRITYWLQLTAVGLVAVILLYVTYSGIRSGNLDAKSEVVLANAKTLAEGINYFYEDQDRFPSDEEFLDFDIMSSYIEGYPPVKIWGGQCLSKERNDSYSYFSLNEKSYELSFCLPSAIEGYKAGNNTVKR